MDLKYRAFISYSHHDARWAKWLVRSLETYRLPDRQKPGVGLIFRDRDEAGAASDLKEEIQRALCVSEHLIVVASPHSARSPYVQAEIEAFAAANLMREVPGRILALIVSGEPNVPTESADTLECFPPALRGGIQRSDGTPLEPLAADARSVGDGKTRALAKLVSGLLGVPYDSLVRRALMRRRRLQLIGAAVGTMSLVAVGIAASVIVRSEVAKRNAELNAHTVEAVNAAEQARRLIGRGNIDGAIPLVRDILADPTLPFIPQAYSVLYSTLFRRGEPSQLDFGIGGSSRPETAALADGTYLTVNGGNLSVWSPGMGITHRRSHYDIENTTKVTSDRDAVFLRSTSGLLRYDVSNLRWQELDLGSIGFEFAGRSQDIDFAAVSPHRVIGCIGKTVFSLSWSDLESGKAKVDWKVVDAFSDIGGGSFGCTNVTQSFDQSILIGTDSGKVIEISFDGKVVRTFDTKNDTLWIEEIEVRKGRIFAGGYGHAAVFEASGGAQIGAFDTDLGVTAKTVSPDGRFFLFGTIMQEPPGITVHDLQTSAQAKASCNACNVGGFIDETSFIAVSGATVTAFDAATGASTADLHIFSSDVDDLLYLPESRALLGLRNYGASEVALLEKGSNAAFLDGTRLDYVYGATFVADDRIAVAEWIGGSVGSPTTVHLFSRGEDGVAHEISSPDLLKLTENYLEFAAVKGGLFSVSELDSINQSAGKYALFDAADGREVLNLHRNTVPQALDSGLLVVDADDGVAIFDPVARRLIPLPHNPAPELRQRWDTAKSTLLVTTADGLSRFNFGPDGSFSETRFGVEGTAIAVCVTSDTNLAYVLRLGADELFIDRIDTTTGTSDATRKITVAEEDAASFLVEGFFFGQSFIIADPFQCDTARAVFREIGGTALVWTPADDAFAIIEEYELPVPNTPIDAGEINDAILAQARFEWTEQGWTLVDSSGVSRIATYGAETSPISSAVYDPSRGFVSAGFEDGTLLVWNVRFSSAPIIELPAHDNAVSILSFGRDSLLTADSNGQISLWPLLDTEALLSLIPNSNVDQE